MNPVEKEKKIPLHKMNNYNPDKTEEIINATYTRREILSLIPLKGLIRAIFSSDEGPKQKTIEAVPYEESSAQ